MSGSFTISITLISKHRNNGSFPFFCLVKSALILDLEIIPRNKEQYFMCDWINYDKFEALLPLVKFLYFTHFSNIASHFYKKNVVSNLAKHQL